MEYNIWQSSTRSILEYIIKAIFSDIPYTISGGFAVQIHSYNYKDRSFKRSTKDIDVLVPNEYKQALLNNLHRERIYYKRQKSAVRDSLDIILANGPKISISFVNSLPDFETIEVNGTPINVEKLESLLVNKFSTYVFRTKEKDIIDLCQLIKILKKTGVNLEEIIKAMNRYNVVEDAEKIFFLFLELNGLIDSAEDYIDLDPEEKEKIVSHLKAEKLICRY